MDIKGKRFSVEEIGKLENGTKVWVEDIVDSYNYSGIYSKGDDRLIPISTKIHSTFSFEFKDIQVYEWLEDMVEVTLADTINFKNEADVVITGTNHLGDFVVIRDVAYIKKIHKSMNKSNKYYIKREDMDKMEKQFTKSDLKDGMVVETKTGNQFLFINEMFIMKNGRSWLNPNSYNDKLTDINEDALMKQYDIMKVYQLDIYRTIDFFKGHKISETLIWERKEEPQVDWSKVEKDTLIEVKYLGSWRKRYFAKFENGEIKYYANGANSITNDGDGLCATNQARLSK